jgi:hypothetical protein
METELKLCKDCKCLVGIECGHKSAFTLDYVNGNHSRHAAQTHRMECDISRDNHCGPEAAHFEAK